MASNSEYEQQGFWVKTEVKEGKALHFEIWTYQDLVNKGIIKEYKPPEIINNG